MSKSTVRELEHPRLHRDWIDPHAYGIVKALQRAGHETYLVGGCVRDLLVGIEPKDFDIATKAQPPQVKRLIHMAYVIGKRFRLVLVKREDRQYEVATFRRDAAADDEEVQTVAGALPTADNVFGTPEEDARRRDFSINALFYDPIQDRLIDYVDGMADISGRIVRMIGEPVPRLREDPIRILRALRLAHRIGFSIAPDLRAAIAECAPTLVQSVLPRRREELLKILRLPEPALALVELYDLGVLKAAFPEIHDALDVPAVREEFLPRIEQLREGLKNPDSTVEIFAKLLLALRESWLEIQPERVADLRDERWSEVLRSELGLYKFEQAVAISAIELLPELQIIEEFQRRGERRQHSFLLREGFELALELAELDRRLSSAQLDFWRDQLAKRPPDPDEPESGRRSRGSRRSRSGRGGPRLPLESQHADSNSQSITTES